MLNIQRSGFELYARLSQIKWRFTARDRSIDATCIGFSSNVGWGNPSSRCVSEYGQIVRSYWLKLPRYYSHLQLDAFVVMPNHIHGILVCADNSVGAGFDSDPVAHAAELSAKPAPTHLSAQTSRHGIPEMIRGFKTFSARCINQRRKMQGVPLWQRNYYEHIIRNDESLQLIRQYIDNNPLSWQEDEFHPDCLSKW